MSSFLQNVLSHNNKSHPSSASFAPYADDLALDQISNRSSLPSSTQPNRFSPGTGATPPETSAPIMTESTSTHTRRRSSSAASGNKPSGLGKSSKRRWRGRPGEIAEADEDRQGGEGEEGSDSTDRSGGSEFEAENADDDSGLEDDEETGLTAGERRRRRLRKRKNSRFDERVTGEMKITKEEERIANQNVIRASVINVTLIGLWYLFSISISLYNKWMFKDEDNTGEKRNVFPFPLFTTALHQIVQFGLASLVIYFFPHFRPRADSLNPHSSESTQLDPVESDKPLMTKWFYMSRIGPCGIATGFDIGLGNMSLRFISLTFFTMCKSSALGFVLLFAFLFRLEQPSWRLVAIISTMTIGVVMMVAGETAFNTLGFVLVMFASCSSGFRWSLTQILLLRHPATSNPFSTIMCLAPVIFASLMLIAIPVEGVSHLLIGFYDLMEQRGNFMAILILLFPGVLAFLMMTSEYALLKRTSVVTLSICGIFKEVAMVIAASLVFDDKLTPINVSGLVITICSIGAYNYIKLRRMKEEARIKAHLENEDYSPILASDPDQDDSEPGSSSSRLARTTVNIPPGSSIQPAVLDSPAKISPVKRPEDLD